MFSVFPSLNRCAWSWGIHFPLFFGRPLISIAMCTLCRLMKNDTLRSIQRKRVINNSRLWLSSETRLRLQKYDEREKETDFCLWSFAGPVVSSPYFFTVLFIRFHFFFLFNFFLSYLCVAFIFPHHNLFHFLEFFSFA